MQTKGIFRNVVLAAGALATLAAYSLDVTLAPSGDIRFGEGRGNTFRPLAALPGWTWLSAKGGLEVKKTGVVPFTFANGTKEGFCN